MVSIELKENAPLPEKSLTDALTLSDKRRASHK